MLPRSRIASVLILGLGAALIVAGLLMPRLLSDDPKIPLDLPDTTYALRAEEGVASRMLPDGSREDVVSPIRRQFHGELIEPADETRVSLRLGASTTRELPPEVLGTDPIYELVDASVWTFTVDRLTGEALSPAQLADQMAGLPLEVPMDGYWVKFPADTQQETYPVFDDMLRRTVPAEFVGEEEIGGNRVLRFRQTIEPTNLATLYRAAHTQITVDEEPAFLWYSGTRDWVVEPGSGMVVDIHENIDLGWDNRAGERKRTYLRFDGGIDEYSTAGLLQQALRVADTTPLRPWSIALIVIGAIFAFGGVAGAFRPEGESGRGDRSRKGAGRPAVGKRALAESGAPQYDSPQPGRPRDGDGYGTDGSSATGPVDTGTATGTASSPRPSGRT